MLYNLLENLKITAIQHPLVQMSAIDDLIEYQNRPVRYPFVNINIVDSNVTNGLKRYNVRIYVLDIQRNVNVAWNKCELILEDILKQNGFKNYNIFYFKDDFKDIVSGCYCDIKYENIRSKGSETGICDYNAITNNYLNTQDTDYMTQQSGDLIMLSRRSFDEMIYFGPSANIPTDSDSVRSLPQLQYQNISNLLNLETGVDYNYLNVCIPVGKTIDKVEDENNLWQDLTDKYIYQNTISVLNNLNVEVEYKIFTYDNLTAYDKNHKHLIYIKNE